MKNCPSFKQKPEKHLRVAVQEQLPVATNAWPRAVTLQLRWAHAAVQGQRLQERETQMQEVEILCAERRETWASKNERGLSANPSSTIPQLNLGTYFQQQAGATYHSRQRFLFPSIHSRKAGALCPNEGHSRPGPPILAAASFTSCPVRAKSSNPTSVPCHVVR